jgi:hypothetical protein
MLFKKRKGQEMVKLKCSMKGMKRRRRVDNPRTLEEMLVGVKEVTSKDISKRESHSKKRQSKVKLRNPYLRKMQLSNPRRRMSSSNNQRKRSHLPNSSKNRRFRNLQRR